MARLRYLVDEFARLTLATYIESGPPVPRSIEGILTY